MKIKDEPLKYNCNYSEFDFKLHNETYYYYCEVVIDETGKIHYAHPSHQQFLINQACKKLKVNQETLFNMCPEMADWLEWLMQITNCVCVWYDFYKGKPNELQMRSLEKLQEYKCCDFEK